MLLAGTGISDDTESDESSDESELSDIVDDDPDWIPSESDDELEAEGDSVVYVDVCNTLRQK